MSYVTTTRCTTCESGAPVAVAPAYVQRARCGPCLAAGREPTGALVPVPRPPVAIVREPEPAPVVAPEPYPAPERTSRDPWPEGHPVPGPVATLVKLAEKCGWVTRLTYARGCPPHGTHGRPLAPVHCVAVQALCPDTRARLVATHSTPVAGGTGKWDVLVWSPTVPLYAGCSITDAKRWITTQGGMDLDEVRHANRVKAITDKVWAMHHAGSTVSAIAAEVEADKQLVVEIIMACKRAGKAAPSKGRAARKEGMA